MSHTMSTRIDVTRISKTEARKRWNTGVLVAFSNSTTVHTVDGLRSMHTGKPGGESFDAVVLSCTGSRRGERSVYFYGIS